MNRRIREVWLRAAAVVAVAVVSASLAATCGGVGAPTGLLEGKVTLGPIRPVEQVGGGLNSRPYAGTVDVETRAGEVLTTVESGNDGNFSVRLAVGSYRLVPRTPGGRSFPHAAPLAATVAAGKTTTVKIAYDSGIR